MKKKYRNRLPKGAEVKGFNAYVENGEIIVNVELKEKFKPKDGDFLYHDSCESYAIFIYKDVERKDIAGCYCGIQCFWDDSTKHFNLNGSDCYTHLSGSRYATKVEKDYQLTVLEKEYHLRWNAETKKLDPIRWKPKNGEKFYYIDNNGKVKVVVCRCFMNFFDVYPNCFKTEESAQKVADQIKDIFKNSKAE